MNPHAAFRLSFLAVTATFFAASAQAQSILPSSPSYSLADDVSVSSTDVVQSYFHADKSYECAIMIADYLPGDEFYVFETSVLDPDGDPVAAAPTGSIYPAVAPVDGVSAVHARARVSLTAEKTGIYKFSVEDAFGVNGSETSTVRCRETTLYGDYNRFFAGVAIVELNNAAGQDIGVTIDIVNSQQQVVVDGQTATAKANTRTDIIFANLPASSFGQIRITHNAPFGALSGTVSEYDFGGDDSITLKRERPLRNAQRR